MFELRPMVNGVKNDNNQFNFGCPLMRAAGRLGRRKDAFDKRDTFRRFQSSKLLSGSAVGDIAAARGALRQMVQAVHGAPSHLAPRLFPLVMQAETILARMVAERDALHAAIDRARAA